MTTFCIVGAKIYTASDDPKIPFLIEDGAIVVENGRISQIGPALDTPPGATVIDGKGKVVTPGFIDAHCHIGIAEDGALWAGADSNESTDPTTADVSVLDGINPRDIAYKDARSAGITCVQVDPGSANIIGGETLVMKTKDRCVVEEMVLKRPSGVKAALGENPKRVYGSQKKSPATRMGAAAVMRRALYAAKDYMRKKEQAKESDSDKIIDYNPGHESLARVLRRELPLRIHCHRTDDIITALRIAAEFDIEITIEHATEGDKLTEKLRESGFAVTMGPSLTDKSKLEVKDIGFEAPVAVSKAGVKMAIITDHPVFPIQYLRIQAGLAIREGMAEDYALLAVTRYAAEIAGVADRVGSLQPGKDADIAVWSGDPFEYDTKVEMLFIDGEQVDIRPAKGGDLL